MNHHTIYSKKKNQKASGTIKTNRAASERKHSYTGTVFEYDYYVLYFWYSLHI